MKKRIGFLSLFGVAALLVAMIGVISALAAPSAAVQGQAVILDEEDGDEIDWARSGATVWLQVNDADLNVAIEISQLVEDVVCTSSVITLIDGVEINTVDLTQGPVQDSTGDDRVNYSDVVATPATADVVTVYSLDVANDRITLACTGNFGPIDVELDYEAAGVSTVGVNSDDLETTPSIVYVKSDADPAGIGVQLTETGVDTGEFGASLLLCTADDCSDASASPPRIQVATEVNDTLELTYDDADDSEDSYSVEIETTPPVPAELLPADGTATREQRPQLSGEVTDVDSGVSVDEDGDPDTIKFVVRAVDLDGDTLGDAENLYPAATGTVTDISDGFSVNQVITSALVAGEDVFVYEWWLVSEDVAGNKGVSDEDVDDDSVCDPEAFNIDTGGADYALCDPYTIRVDVERPTIASAITGNWYDPDEEAEQSGTDAKNTSIAVYFNEALDGDSVSVADFDSDDVDIEDIDWYSDVADRVYLTVEAMDSDLEPEIELVGLVLDEAGNASLEDDVDADDGVPATLTVTVEGTAASRPATDEEITITVSADESLTGAPSVTVKKIGSDFTLTPTDLAGTPRLVGVRTWEVEFDVTTPGLFNVFVEGTDLGARITAEVGLEGPEIDIEDDDAILFEVDTGIPDPATTPEDEGETDQTSPYIILDFADEGKEYGLDANDDLTTTPANVVEDFDDHDTVTITEATLDGEDIVFSTGNDILFLYRATDLALGEHTVVVTYEDEVGNEVEEFDFTFEVIELVLAEIPLRPGMNLISLPGEPADPAINSVITVDAVSAVITYDSAAGTFLSATRDAEGNLTGDLTIIDTQHAYWVTTTTFDDIEVDIPGTATGGMSPPYIPVWAGWNLLPVVSVSGNPPDTIGDEISADTYFGSIDWVTAYTFDPVADAWIKVLPNNFDMLEVGLGYWVYATEDGILVP